MKRSVKPSLEWGLDMEKGEAEEFFKVLQGSPSQLRQLRKIVRRRLSELSAKEVDEEAYKNPAYPMWQAYINGRKTELQRILTLTDFIED